MGKMNKILTNQPVELTSDEVANLSKTLSAVRTSGGGTGGKVYTGINGVSVDNTSDTVGLSVEMQNIIAGKLDSSDASATYAPISAADAVDVLAPASSNWDAAFAVLTQYSAAGQWLTSHQSLDNYYTKSQTSAADEIGNALNGKQDTLSFTYDSSGCITHINSSAIAGEGGGGTVVYNGIDGVYVDGNNIGLSASYSAAIEDVSGKVDKPKGSSLANKLLAYQTSGATSGWLELVIPGAVAITAESGISADGYKIGLVPSAVNALNGAASKDYVNSSFLPLSGGTVSGQLIVSAAQNTFDDNYIKCINNGNVGFARFGVGSWGGAVIKAVDGNNNPVQVNVRYNANNNELIQVQKSNADVGYLIPANTATTTAGLTNDGILHIILAS